MGVNRRIDFGGQDWSAHCQEHWLEDAANTKFPGVLRVAFAAYGRHAANGHAKFRAGELSKMLVRQVAGELIIPTRQAVWKHIQKAIEYELLEPGSTALCLVVPAHRVQGGRGNPDAPCTRRHGKASTSRGRRSVRNVNEREGRLTPKRQPPEVDVSGSRSLSLYSPLPDTDRERAS